MPSLFQLSFGYFLSYIATGVLIKLFTGKVEQGFLGLNSIEYLVYSTVFSSLFCVAVVLMRGTVIVASRLVDLILNLQGLQKKHIPWQEEVAVALSIGAIAVKIFLSADSDSRLPLLGIVLLTCYFFAYLLRLFIMNRSKILGVAGRQLDQRLYFGSEQLFASATLFAVSAPLLLWIHAHYASAGVVGKQFVDTVYAPGPYWWSAALSGTPYAFIAFLSVFLFLYPGKTATFTGVLNRLVSLLGGTASSLVLYLFFSGKLPPSVDWISLAFILAAIGFLAWGDHAEKRQKSAPSGPAHLASELAAELAPQR